jgi:hypothetical protein
VFTDGCIYENEDYPTNKALYHIEKHKEERCEPLPIVKTENMMV